MTLSLPSLARAIGGLGGWRRNLFAFIIGVLSTLTLAPFYLFPLLIPSFTGLFWLIDAAPSNRRRFWDGWWWGWGFYMTGLYWFCIALLTDADAFAWLIPFALFGLTGVIAIYSGIACWLMSWVRLRGAAKIFVFSVVWTIVEYGRGHLLSGFPWNLAGYSFGFSNASLQLASLVGVYGLTWLAVYAAAIPALLADGKRHIRLVCFIWGALALGIVWGDWQLQQADHAPEKERYVDGVMLRLVQANILQTNKWDPKLQSHGMREQVRLTQSPGLEHITHVIWPETAVPYSIKQGASLPRMLGSALPPKTILLTGSLRMEGSQSDWQIWNSMVALNHDGDIVDSYDKIHLVPFGEFQPLRDYVPKSWMTPVGDKDFSWGQGVHTLDHTGLPATYPLICYEAIFPELPMAQALRPRLLLNITNDAWFGLSTGPQQHFQMARMRAVEQGLPLIRVANTGISAVVDSYGRIVSSLALGTQGILDSKLPTARLDGTIYSNHNGFFIAVLIFVAMLLILKHKKL